MYTSISFPSAVVFTLLASSALAQSQDQSLCGNGTWYNSSVAAYPYYWNNNAWGNDGSGFSCLNVTDDGAAWSVTYKWTGTPTLVKGFPYMKVWPSNLPVQLSDISHLNFTGKWRTSVVSSNSDSDAAFAAVDLHSNVALDMFLSDNATNSTLLGPPIEIMIWPWYIPTVKPLGWDESTPQIDSVNISGTNYSLYHGFNAGGQHVFSWLAHENLTSVNADFAPLLEYIWQKGLLSPNLYLGQLEFGTEVLRATDTMLFEASDYSLELIRHGDSDDYSSTTSSITSTITTTTQTAMPTSVLATATTASASASRGAAAESVTAGGAGGSILALILTGLGLII